MLLDAVSTRILPSGLSLGVAPSCQVPRDHLGGAILLPVLYDTVTLGRASPPGCSLISSICS